VDGIEGGVEEGEIFSGGGGVVGCVTWSGARSMDLISFHRGVHRGRGSGLPNFCGTALSRGWLL